MAKIAFTEYPEVYEDWMKENLESHELLFYDKVMDSEELVKEFKDKDIEILSTFIYTRVDKKAIDELDSLKLVTTRATGFDNIDVEYATEKGVAVANVPGYGAYPVAEHAFGLMLAIARKIPTADKFVKENQKFDYRPFRGAELFGKTIGIIGTGNIGLHMIKMARGAGMKVLAYDVIKRNEASYDIGFEYTELDDLLEKSDFVSLHVPLLDATRHMIDADSFKKMKDDAFLINSARGGIVDTAAMINALKNGEIAGAAIDAVEDMGDLKNGLTELENIVITPHIAFHTKEADIRRMETTVENINSMLEEGKPENQILPEKIPGK